jgi:hypothetical protein
MRCRQAQALSSKGGAERQMGRGVQRDRWGEGIRQTGGEKGAESVVIKDEEEKKEAATQSAADNGPLILTIILS